MNPTRPELRLEIAASPAEAAELGADLIEDQARAAVAARGRAVVAVSGGHTPWTMLAELARRDLPWSQLSFVQVDERDCPITDDSRNLKHIRESLPNNANIVSMPVEAGPPGAAQYAERLGRLAGTPPVLDVVHLGLGPDGHTASLVPGDPVLEVTDRDVAWTGTSYQGHRRMTLTYPVLDRARLVFWLATGAEKRDAVKRLLAGDPGIPAGRVRCARRVTLVDLAAAGTAAANPEKLP